MCNDDYKNDGAFTVPRRQLGTRLDWMPSQVLEDPLKLRQVAQALALHGVIALQPEIGLSPSMLAEFTIQLATEHNKNDDSDDDDINSIDSSLPGRLVQGVQDLSDAACSNVRIGDHPNAPLAPENVALVLSNVPLLHQQHDDDDDDDATAAAAFGVAPMYCGPGRLPSSSSVSLSDNKTVLQRLAGVDANLAAVWHQDEQSRRLPAAFTVLYCVLTPDTGCDTVYADTQVAFGTLPDSLRSLIINNSNNKDDDEERHFQYRVADHSLATIDTEIDPSLRVDQEVQTHPLVLRGSKHVASNFLKNNDSGSVEKQKDEEHQHQNHHNCDNNQHNDNMAAPPTSLYLGSRNARVSGLSQEESLHLMDQLIAHATQGPQAVVYSHRHEPGVLLIACNRTTIHRATPGVVTPLAHSKGDARVLIRFQAEEPFPLLHRGL